MEKIKTEAFDTPTKGSRMLPFLIVKSALACDMLFQDKRMTCKLSHIYIPILLLFWLRCITWVLLVCQFRV